MILGITGGIATGKSTVSKMFGDHGAVVIDADQIAREVVEPGTQGLMRIIEEFGTDVLRNGRLNRAALGNIIFEDKMKRKSLEHILHPLIREKLMEDTKKALLTSNIVIWDVPLLIEKKMMSLVDYVILVYASAEVQLVRLIGRNGFSEKEALRRIRSQMNIEEKKGYADISVNNQESFEYTQEQVDHIWRGLVKEHLS